MQCRYSQHYHYSPYLNSNAVYIVYTVLRKRIKIRTVSNSFDIYLIVAGDLNAAHHMPFTL